MEELYIIRDGERQRIDLDTPSGIVLSLESNLFGDLSKITSSHSYTFRLPLTQNNRRLLDAPEDVRSESTAIGRRMPCEYLYNGMAIIHEGNIYVDGVDEGYNAVMTFNIISGFKELNDSGKSIRELVGSEGSDDELTKFSKETIETTFSNEQDAAWPFYYAGIKVNNVSSERAGAGSIIHKYRGYPCIPIYRILEMINEEFGTMFNIGEASSYPSGSSGIVGDFMERGVVPFVRSVTLEEDKDDFTFKVEKGHGVKLIQTLTPSGAEYKMGYDYDQRSTGSIIADNISASEPVTEPGTQNLWFTDFVFVMAKIQADQNGVIHLRVSGDITFEFSRTALANIDPSKLAVEIWGECESGYEHKEDADENYNNRVLLASIGADSEGCSASHIVWGDDCYTEAIELDIDLRDYVRVGASRPGGISRHPSSYKLFTTIRNETEYTPEAIGCPNGSEPIRIEVVAGYSGGRKDFYTHPMASLPDISCMDFVKGLYYLDGGVPYVASDGSVKCMRYDDIKENMENGVYSDWSRKVIGAVQESPDTIAFEVEGICRNNMYKTKSDEENGDDVIYERGEMNVEVGGELLDASADVATLPFYTGVIQDNKAKVIYDEPTELVFRYPERNGFVSSMRSYNSEESYDMEEEAKAVIGLIKRIQLPTGAYAIGMDVMNGFADEDVADRYEYLAQILAAPRVIEERLRLNEFDIMDIDYSKPVYIEKYNSFLALISIDFDTAGWSKCRLLRLPN